MRERATLAALASVGPILAWILAAAIQGSAAFNDFNVYWLSGRMVDRGLSPHDFAAFTALAQNEGLTFVLGTGYSYPLPFAVVMVPLSRLPYEGALGVFLGGSIVVFGLAVAGWLRWTRTWIPGAPISVRRMYVTALAAGFFPPVLGTIAAGQANLLVLGMLAPGVAWLFGRRLSERVGSGVLIGLAAIVKLVPVVILMPVLLARRWATAAGIVAGSIGALAAAAWLAPASTHGGDSLAVLLEPDPYVTNISINGFVTRLVVSTERTAALLPGAFEPGPLMATLTAVLAVATGVVLWRARGGFGDPRRLAIAIGLAILAGTMGAPKNSFWNTALVLIPVGLLLAVEAPHLRLDGFDRTDHRLIRVWLAGQAVQSLVWVVPPSPTTIPFAGLITLTGSGALFGMLALWWVFVRRLAIPRRSDSQRQSAALS